MTTSTLKAQRGWCSQTVEKGLWERARGWRMSFLDGNSKSKGLEAHAEYGMSLADGNLPEALSFCWVWRWGCVLESTLGIYSELKMSYERLQKSSQEVPIIQFSFQLCRVIGSFQSAKTCNASIFLAMEVIYIYLFYNYSPIDRAIPFSNRIIILNK